MTAQWIRASHEAPQRRFPTDHTAHIHCQLTPHPCPPSTLDTVSWCVIHPWGFADARIMVPEGFAAGYLMRMLHPDPTAKPEGVLDRKH